MGGLVGGWEGQAVQYYFLGVGAKFLYKSALGGLKIIFRSCEKMFEIKTKF